jgi:twitching motility two-component system response regulator PilG
VKPPSAWSRPVPTGLGLLAQPPRPGTAPVPAAPAFPPQEPPPADAVPSGTPARGLVLVVDDSPTVLKVVEFELRKHRLEVVTAPDGAAALERLQHVQPDLVLLDINMPHLDGYQVCRSIRGDDRTSRIPVVMLSGKDGFFDKVRGRMAGAAGYITKPFDPASLVEMLAKYFPVRA